MRLNMWKYGPDFLHDEGTLGGADNSGTQEHPISAPWGGANGGVWNIGEGEAAKPWWNALPDEAARKHVEAKQYASPAELALANYNLTRLQTGDPQVLSIPAADAPKEAWDQFYTKIGRPETPDKYELQFGEGVQVDEGMVKFGKELFHEMGLPQAKAQAAADKWNAFVQETNAKALEAQDQQNSQELDALKSKWGAELDANTAAGRTAVAALGLSNEAIQRIEGAVGSAAIVELLAMIGKKAGEGTGLIKPNGQYDANNPDTMSKEQANARITELRGDATFQAKYMDAKHPEHESAMKMMERLYAKAS